MILKKTNLDILSRLISHIARGRVEARRVNAEEGRNDRATPPGNSFPEYTTARQERVGDCCGELPRLDFEIHFVHGL